MLIKMDPVTGRAIATGPRLSLNSSSRESVFDFCEAIVTVQAHPSLGSARMQLINALDREPIATTRFRDCVEDFLCDVSSVTYRLAWTFAEPDSFTDGANICHQAEWLLNELIEAGYAAGMRLNDEFLTDEEADADGERKAWTLGDWEE